VKLLGGRTVRPPRWNELNNAPAHVSRVVRSDQPSDAVVELPEGHGRITGRWRRVKSAMSRRSPVDGQSPLQTERRPTSGGAERRRRPQAVIECFGDRPTGLCPEPAIQRCLSALHPRSGKMKTSQWGLSSAMNWSSLPATRSSRNCARACSRKSPLMQSSRPPRLGEAALSRRVLDVMARVPRHEFVPVELRPYAYADSPLPIGFGKSISQPFIVAVMTDLLKHSGGRRFPTENARHREALGR